MFVDEDAGLPPLLNGQRVLSYAQFLAEPAQTRHAVLAIAASVIREKLAKRCAQDGVLPWTVQAANVVSMDAVELGAGAILSPFVTLTSSEEKLGVYKMNDRLL